MITDLSFEKSYDNAFDVFSCRYNNTLILGSNENGKWQIMNYKNINSISACDLIGFIEQSFNKKER